MRPLLFLSCLSAVVAIAAAPPAKEPSEWRALIDQLGDDDSDVRVAAVKKLDAIGEDVLPALRRAAEGHAEVEVRLSAGVIAGRIEDRVYGKEHMLEGHTDGVMVLAVSPDGKRIASGAWQNDSD